MIYFPIYSDDILLYTLIVNYNILKTIHNCNIGGYKCIIMLCVIFNIKEN